MASNADSRRVRAKEIEQSIRDVLIRDWDPIHIHDVHEAQDEYDRYISGVYQLLARGASESVIASYLASIERESMGFSTSADALLTVARRLKQLDVRLPQADSAP